MIPLTSKKPVDSHWTVAVDTSKTRIKVGRAVAKKVWFKTVAKEPIITTMTSRMRL